MTQPASSQAQKYFLGINGEQVGPLSESDVISKIRQGQVPSDALMWFEGLSEWQSVQSIPAFNEAYAAPSAPAPAPPPPPPAPVAAAPAPPPAPAPVAESPRFVPSNARPAPGDMVSTFADGSAEPVFSNKEAVFGRTQVRPKSMVF